MGFREVSVVEVRTVLRGWLEGAGLRMVAERAGVDRKTVRRYVAAAEAAGLCRDADVEALTDEPVGAVVVAVRPVRLNGHGAAWDLLLARQDQITAWVRGSPGQDALSVVKIEELLPRQGCLVPYRTLHRFDVAWRGFRVRSTTMRIADGEPGVECQMEPDPLVLSVAMVFGSRGAFRTNLSELTGLNYDEVISNATANGEPEVHRLAFAAPARRSSVGGDRPSCRERGATALEDGHLGLCPGPTFGARVSGASTVTGRHLVPLC